jgi:hypothetical protein
MAYQTLFDWVYRWCQPGEQVYAVPIMAFTSPEALRAATGESGVRILERHDEIAVCASSAQELARIMTVLRCEEVALAYAHNDRRLLELMEAVVNYNERYESNNAPFLAQQTGWGGFVFFAHSHWSLEVIGSNEFVGDRCARPLLDHVLRAQGTQ